jgi:hypothetical protein
MKQKGDTENMIEQGLARETVEKKRERRIKRER